MSIFPNNSSILTKSVTCYQIPSQCPTCEFHYHPNFPKNCLCDRLGAKTSHLTSPDSSTPGTCDLTTHFASSWNLDEKKPVLGLQMLFKKTNTCSQFAPINYVVESRLIPKAAIPSKNLVCHLPVPPTFQFMRAGTLELFNIQKPLGIGKYGQVFMVSKLNDFGITSPYSDNQYAVKRMTHRLSYELEMQAYSRMYSRNITSFTKHKSTKLLKKSFSFSNTLDVRKQLRFNLHPFIMRLISSGSMRVKVDQIPDSKKEELMIQQTKTSRKRALRLFASLFTPPTAKVFLLLHDYAGGGDLHQLAFNYLKRPMHPSQAAFYIAELTEALIWLHDIGVVHQDLKLDNVLIHSDGHVALADFGLAVVPPDGPGTPFLSTITSESRHMPPEISEGGSGLIWHAVDWYSLGVLFYRLTFHVNPPQCLSNIQMSGLTGSLLQGLLCFEPKCRLGGGRLGGRTVLAHPGLQHLMLPNGCGSKLPGNLCRYMRNNIDSKTSSIQNPTKVRFKIESMGFSISQPMFPGEMEIPRWLDKLRDAIRKKRLEPPFLPLQQRDFSETSPLSSNVSYSPNPSLRPGHQL